MATLPFSMEPSGKRPKEADYAACLDPGGFEQFLVVPGCPEIISISKDGFLHHNLANLDPSSNSIPVPTIIPLHPETFSLTFLQPDRLLFGIGTPGAIMTGSWPPTPDIELIDQTGCPSIDFISCNSTGSSIAYANESSVFLRYSNDPDVDYYHNPNADYLIFGLPELVEDAEKIIFLQFVPNSEILVIFTSYSVLRICASTRSWPESRIETSPWLELDTSCDRPCVPCFNAGSELFVAREGSLHKLRLAEHQMTSFELEAIEPQPAAIAATIDRVALAGRAGEIFICAFDPSHINLIQILAGQGFIMTQVTWVEQALIAADDAGTLHIWVSPCEPGPCDLLEEEELPEGEERDEQIELNEEEELPEEPPEEPPEEEPDEQPAEPAKIRPDGSRIIPLTSDPPAKKSRFLSAFDKGAIIRMAAEGRTFRDMGEELHRSPGGCYKFLTKFQKTGEFSLPMGRPPSIRQSTTAAVVAATVRDRRSSLRVVAAMDEVRISPSSVRTQRRKEGFRFYKSIPVPPLTPKRRITRVNFCRYWDEHWRPHANIFTDESMVAQNLDQGGVWRRRGELIPEGTYEVDHHPISVMVRGAIGPNYRSKLIRCPARMNGVSYAEMLASNNVIESLNRKFGPGGYIW
jgi:hypothetical protein